MQHVIPSTPEGVGWWHPPDHVAKQLIAHAMRKIPNNKRLLEKLNPPSAPLAQLKPHVFNSGGTLQWAFQ